MRRLAFLLLLVLCTPLISHAQDSCPWGFGGEKAADGFEKALEHAPSCRAAAKLMQDCAWGSSADVGFAAITIPKCEKGFLYKLSPSALRTYGDKMNICSYEYDRQSGTMYVSAASLCHVDVAAAFAADPATASRPLARASFDCATAHTSVETAICTDPLLGQADIILGHNYATARKLVAPQARPALIANQRRWVGSLSARCSLTTSKSPSTKSMDCLRDKFELRFAELDFCLNEADGFVSCLDAAAKEDAEDSPPSRIHTSFDCSKPSSPLEIAICADPVLAYKDMELYTAYHLAEKLLDPAQHSALSASEDQWLDAVNHACSLASPGLHDSPATTACLRDLFEKRIVQVETCPQKPVASPIHCLNDLRPSSRRLVP